jgi:hypothetical protein
MLLHCAMTNFLVASEEGGIQLVGFVRALNISASDHSEEMRGYELKLSHRMREGYM